MVVQEVVMAVITAVLIGSIGAIIKLYGDVRVLTAWKLTHTEDHLIKDMQLKQTLDTIEKDIKEMNSLLHEIKGGIGKV